MNDDRLKSLAEYLDGKCKEHNGRLLSLLAIGQSPEDETVTANSFDFWYDAVADARQILNAKGPTSDDATIVHDLRK